MVVDVALYTLVHQPRRLKLPAQPIPRYASIEDLTRCLFDDRLNQHYFRQVAQASYYPATRTLLEVVRKQGLRLALGFSLSFVRQAQRWEPGLLDLFRELVAEEGVELIASDPYHSLHCLIDLPAFAWRMGWMADELEKLFGKRPTVTDMTEMCMSASIYNALDAAGFRGALIDGHPSLLDWRSSTYLYRYSDEQLAPVELKTPTRGRRGSRSSERQAASSAGEAISERGLLLLSRHTALSEDVSQRFSHRSWSGYPLYADTYARWIAQTAGDFVLLNWDFETLGERHAHATGIFEFLQALPDELERHGVSMRTPSALIEQYAEQRVYHLPLPVHPPVWSEMLGLDGHPGHQPQRELFQLARDIYNLARLTENAELLDLAGWMAQSDNFRLLHEAHGQLAAGVVPPEWWRLGAHEIARTQKQVYLNVLAALEVYLPARLQRQARKRATSVVAEPVVAQHTSRAASKAAVAARSTRRKSSASKEATTRVKTQE